MKAEERDYVDFLRDILDSIDKIGSFIEGFDLTNLLKMTKPYML